jgi:hypothetical protein
VAVLKSVPWLHDFIVFKLKELKAYRTRVIESEPPKPPSVEEVLRTATTAQLVSATAERLLNTQAEILHSLVEIRRAIVPGSLQQYVPPVQASVAEPMKKKRRFIIIGLIGSQVEAVRQRYRDEKDVEFDFQGAREYKGLRQCEQVFTMIKFIDHCVYDAIKVERPDHIRITSGMTALFNRIEQQIKNGKVQSLAGL